MATPTVAQLPAAILPLVGTDLFVVSRGGATLWQGTLTDLKTFMAASLALTGTPTAVTPGNSDDSTKVATTAWVKARIAEMLDSAPGALDTLNELAAALGDDPNFAATVTTALAGKQATDAALTVLVGLAANKFVARSSSGATAAKDITDFALSILDDANAAAVISTIFGNATANTVLAGPASGAAAAPTLRALVKEDLRSYLLNASAVAVPMTVTGSDETLQDITLPVLGANDYLRLYTRWSCTSSGNNKAPKAFLDATQIIGFNVSTVTQVEIETFIHNENNAAIQKVLTNYRVSSGGTATSVLLAKSAAAIDLSSAKHLYIKGQRANAGDSFALEAFSLDLKRV